MKSDPFIAHSDVTGRIYIISGKEKYDVTDQVIKAMENTGRMKGELWIPTKEKQPEDFEHVYAQTIYGEHVITQYIPPMTGLKNHTDGYYGEIDSFDYDYFDIVAWRHLPEPYKSGVSEGKQIDREIARDVMTAEWIFLDECSNSGYYCSNCHKKLVKEGWSNTVKKIKYCPNCGFAMMPSRHGGISKR